MKAARVETDTAVHAELVTAAGTAIRLVASRQRDQVDAAAGVPGVATCMRCTRAEALGLAAELQAIVAAASGIGARPAQGGITVPLQPRQGGASPAPVLRQREAPAGGLAGRVLDMARTVQGRDIDRWPGWSTGESVAVALVLDDPGALRVPGFTILEAVDRLAGELDVAQLRAIERAL